VARLPLLGQAERHAIIDVVEHLAEIERRRLYLKHAYGSIRLTGLFLLSTYLTEDIGRYPAGQGANVDAPR